MTDPASFVVRGLVMLYGGCMAEKCTATSKSTGKRCERWPVSGANVCRVHGGAAPQVKRAIEKRRAKDEIEKMAAEIDRYHNIGFSPVEHLLHELYVSAGNAAVLGEKVRDWEPSGDEGAPEDVTETHLWTVYSEERDRHTHYANLAVKAGIAERQVKLAERQALEVAEVVRAILTDLGVMDKPETPQIIRKHMLRIEPGNNVDTQTPRLGTREAGNRR